MYILHFPMILATDESAAAWVTGVLGTVLGALGLVVARKSLIHGGDALRQDACLRVWEQWSSEFMRGCRTSLWKHLESTVALAIGSPSPFTFDDLRRDHPELMASAGSIAHFMADLGAMLAAGAVDRSLAKALFKGPATQWIGVMLHPGTHWGPEESWIRPGLTQLQRELDIDVIDTSAK